MNGDDFIEVADWLSAARTDPAASRTSVSRAYYGCFHLAMDFLASLGFYPRGGDKKSQHSWAQEMLIWCKVEPATTVGRLLNNLHESRKDADYHFNVAHADSSANAKLCVNRANEIRLKLLQCLKEPARSQIQAGLQQHRNVTQK